MRRFFKIFPGVVLFLAGLWFSHRPILEGRHLYVHGNLGDARYVNLMLEHNYSWLVKGWPESYWNPPWAFFPETGVTAFSDTLLSSEPLYIPLRMLGLSALSAFQVWFLVVSVLNFGAFFWFLRRLDVTHLGASVGAFLFSFSMPASVLLGHAQLHARFFIPLALVAFHAHLTASQALRRGLWLVAAAAIVGFQFWSSAYLGWFFVFALGVAALGFAMQPGVFNQMLPAVRRAPLWYACGACGFLLVTAPLAFQYRANAAVRSWEETLHYVASPGALLHAHPGAYLYHFLGATPLLEDGADVMFAGFLLLCMPVAFFVMMRRTKNGPGAGHSVGVASLVTALVLLVVSMRWGDFTLWKFVY
ncbi:MAG: hypothetical protein HY042_10800, partial [Spirochaetia bacterium]|nr:hypothetical protein [Spirochaetia bacterium]